MEWTALEGQRLDSHFQLHKLIGRGGFGAVFDADHVVDGTVLRRVAVKVIPRTRGNDRQLQELIAATTLRHPSLVESFTAGYTEIAFGSNSLPLLYIVMELAGGTLEGRLRHGPLSFQEWLNMATSVVSGLEYLHSADVSRIHRDVKPSNILWCGTSWKLGDFGLTRAQERPLDFTRHEAGTLAYMPPEAGRGIVSPAWDIWSLGVVLAEALGERPFRGDTEEHLREAIRYNDPFLPSAANPGLRLLLSACLAKKLTKRPPASVVAEALTPPTSGRQRQILVAPNGKGDFETIGSALAAATGDDRPRIAVRPGTYTETLHIDRPCEIVAEGSVTLQALAGSALIVSAPDAVLSGCLIRSVDQEAVVMITGGRIAFTGTRIGGRAGAGVLVAGAKSSPSFVECHIEGEFRTGLYIRESADAFLDRCTIGGASVTGLHIADRAHPVVRRTSINRCGMRGVLIADSGWGILDHCDIEANNGAGVELSKGADTLLVGCRIVTNSGPGIHARAGAGGTVRNSVLQGNREGAWRLDRGHQLKRELNSDD